LLQGQEEKDSWSMNAISPHFLVAGRMLPMLITVVASWGQQSSKGPSLLCDFGLREDSKVWRQQARVVLTTQFLLFTTPPRNYYWKWWFGRLFGGK